MLSRFVLLLLVASIALGAPSSHEITIQRIGSTPFIGSAGTEIAAFDPETKRLFSTNVTALRIDIFDIANPAQPAFITSVPLTGTPNSITVRDGIVAVAVENLTRTSPGTVSLFNAGGVLLSSVTVGAVPDMLTFTHNGRRLLVANEGEPNDTYTIDPEGSVSIIDMTPGAANVTQANVRTASFAAFNSVSLDPSIRVYGPNATVSQDFEPECITISHDSKTAWVTLQENNALAILDIEAGVFTHVVGLGFKDYMQVRNPLDPSDRDNANANGGAIVIGNWPVLGMYEPDGIASYRVGGETYLVMANEGDTRDYPGFSEVKRVSTLGLDPSAFPNAGFLQLPQNLGRLNVTNQNGNTDADPLFEKLYAFGARSFSIRSAAGQLIYDSGDDFEQKTRERVPLSFNSNGTSSTFDSRSDDKGPEPEGVVLGKVSGRTYAFILLERTGGIMIYDVSNPFSPKFVDYVNTTAVGDIAPEAAVFISEEESPNGRPLLVVPHEVSGNLAIFEISRN